MSHPLADLVTTSDAVASTAARSAKVAALAELLRRVPADEVGVVVGFLVGDPRQGRVGIGWASVRDVASSDPTGETITVADVDGLLDEVQRTTGPGSVGRRQELLGALFARATPAEADFLRRLLLGELRQGALAGVMTDAVAKAADVPLAVVRRAAMLAGDLCEVASVAMRDPGGLGDIGLEVLRPVLPMLAATAADVGEALAANGLSSVEWKLDGARIQAHRTGDEVRLFTRNLNDVTARLPDVVDVVLGFAASALILDGEVFGAGIDDEQPDPFQDAMSRFSRHEGGGGLTVRFFDVLHLDGRDLIDEPLSVRRAELERLTGPLAIPAVVTEDPDEAAAFAEDAIGRGHEGVMVKGVNSTYEAGRRGSAWRKVKPVRTLDLVVLAAEWGSGRRQGWLSNLHLGARASDGDGFVMVGKTFKGLTDALLAWQTEQFLAREVRRGEYTVHVRPELVVEIALDGAQRSSRYPGGVALRFARVKRYRDDKGPEEADTIDAVRALLK